MLGEVCARTRSKEFLVSYKFANEHTPVLKKNLEKNYHSKNPLLMKFTHNDHHIVKYTKQHVETCVFITRHKDVMNQKSTFVPTNYFGNNFYCHQIRTTHDLDVKQLEVSVVQTVPLVEYFSLGEPKLQTTCLLDDVTRTCLSSRLFYHGSFPFQTNKMTTVV